MTQTTALQILKLGHTTFLTGAAGAGKSYVLREYISYLRKHGVRYAVTASTGIASTHINGTTIHSWSGIGIKQRLTSYDLDALEEKQNLYKRWNETEVLVIDEISMLHASFIDMLDKVAKHMRRNVEPFGGMQIIFTGDFFQLPPIVKQNDAYENADVFAFTSNAWKAAKPVVCYLTEQFRQEDDKLSDILNAIRSGDIEEEHFQYLEEAHKQHKTDHIKLYTHNEDVDTINRQAFEKIKGDSHTYEMVTSGKAALVESLKNNCLAEEVLQLKVGAKVICIKNNPERLYVNGSMGEVVSFDKEGTPVIELVNGKRVSIKADTWRIEEDGKVKAEICQLPLKLAWAITVHKSQGMTLDKASIDLSRSFASGQGYVALSRLKSLSGLHLAGFNPQAFHIVDIVREEDILFKKKSKQAEDAIQKYSNEDIESLHAKFLSKAGGTVEEQDDTQEEDFGARIPSHIKTKEMLEEGLLLEDIAERRNISVETVIGHIEKLVEAGEMLDLKHILPKSSDRQKITKAFKELETTKLTPVFEFLHGKYNYAQLRLVRAALSLG